MKETACQRELALMMEKKALAYSLMDLCFSCAQRLKDRPFVCREKKCRFGVALEQTGYTIPLRSEWE